jgi:hypothetical protein
VEAAKMRLMVFLHGTSIMHRGAIGLTREERVRQIRQADDESIRDFASYVPIGKIVEKLKNWKAQGAEILYLSSNRDPTDVEKDRRVLAEHDFPPGPVLFRNRNETYASVVEKASPDILIEDDCESIGGQVEMTYPNMSAAGKKGVKSIVVREFGGIDHLPDDLNALRDWHET